MSTEPDPVGELENGRAQVDLSSWWKVRVEGTDASGWLNDLLTVELEEIEAGEMRHSLLLSPTGKIRAAVGVTLFEDAYLLIQDPVQPSRIDTLLDPYVLSSDVRLSDRTEQIALFAFPSLGGASAASGFEGTSSYSPSLLGPGTDVITPAGSSPAVDRTGRKVGPEDVETWRVRRGVARFGVDLTADSLPHEVELGDAIAYGKGCFLGQESVARVRNLGRPPFVLLAADAQEIVEPGEQVFTTVLTGEPVGTEDKEAGIVTSARPRRSGGSALIARVRWAMKEAPLRTSSGVELESRGPASAA